MFEQNLTSEALTVTTVTSQDQITQKPLRDSVKASLKNYLAQLNGQEVTELAWPFLYLLSWISENLKQRFVILFCKRYSDRNLNYFFKNKDLHSISSNCLITVFGYNTQLLIELNKGR